MGVEGWGAGRGGFGGLGASSSGWLLGWAPCGYFRVKSLDDVVYTAHLFLVAFL